MNPSDNPLIAGLTRRSVVSLGLGLAAALHTGRVRAASASRDARVQNAQHFPFGPVLPTRPIRGLPVRTHVSVVTDLSALLSGRVSAVQLMFTGCSATCPIQGALFSQAQELLGTQTVGAQFVSISIDPLADTPAELARWLGRFQARAGWVAAAPRVEDVERLTALLGSGGEVRQQNNDPHTGQVFIVDRRAELVFRTPSMPRAADIVATLRRVADRG